MALAICSNFVIAENRKAPVLDMEIGVSRPQICRVEGEFRMSPFKSMPHSDFEVVSPQGEVRAKGRGIFSAEQVTVFDEKLLVFSNDEIRRTIPSGAEEVFTVVDPRFYGKMAGIPAHFQIKVRRKGTFPRHEGGYYNISVSGENARVNLGSTDNSSNVVTNSGVFADLIGAIEGSIQDGSEKTALIEGVRAMESAKGTPDFAAAYSTFVGVAANHITVLAPFLPALSGYLAG